eukprot:4197130-Ditylum_brightwellii.AAC.1
MRTGHTITKRSNLDVERAINPFLRPAPRQLEHGQFHAYKLRTNSADLTSLLYVLSGPFFDDGTLEEWIKF